MSEEEYSERRAVASSLHDGDRFIVEPKEIIGGIDEIKPSTPGKNFQNEPLFEEVNTGFSDE